MIFQWGLQMLTLNRSVKTSLTIGLIQGLLLWLASTLNDPGVRIEIGRASCRERV